MTSGGNILLRGHAMEKYYIKSKITTIKDLQKEVTLILLFLIIIIQELQIQALMFILSVLNQKNINLAEHVISQELIMPTYL